jgi:hypothetical protein
VMVPPKGAIECDVSDSRVLPELEFLAASRSGSPPVPATRRVGEAGGVAAFLLGIGAELGEFRLGRAAGGIGQHHPSVTPFRDAPERQIMMPPEPDWHTAPRRKRIDAGIIDVMPLPVEAHVRLRPQGLQGLHDLHLFLRPPSPIVKVLVQTHELHLVPADPNP